MVGNVKERKEEKKPSSKMEGISGTGDECIIGITRLGIARIQKPLGGT